MNHRKRVLAAINHQLHDRIPTYAGAIEYPHRFAEKFGLKNAEELYEYSF